MSNPRLIILLLVLFIPLISYGQKRPRKPAQSTTAKNNIRQIDFLNFTYVLSDCASGQEEYVSSGNKVQLKKGEYEKGGLYGFYVGVTSRTYADLTGYGKEEAIVQLMCGMLGGMGTGSGTFSEYYIYFFDKGQAHFLEAISDSDMWELYKRHYDVSDDSWDGIFHVTKIESVRNSKLTFKALSGGNKGKPNHVVTLQYSWGEEQFILDGKPSRRKYTGTW